MATKAELNELRDALSGKDKLVSNVTSEGWDHAVVWSRSAVDFPEFVTVEESYEASGDAPAMKDKDVEGWNKYEVTA